MLLFLCFKAARQRIVDFRGYYAAGQIVRTGNGQHLYDYETQRIAQGVSPNLDISNMRFVSPPFTALLFAPFSKLHFIPAYIAFLIFNLVAAGLALFLMRPSAPTLFAHGTAAPAVLILSFFPLGIALGQGQLSVLLLLLYCGAHLAIQRNSPFLAGLLVSLALMKFQTALPVALLFFVWRKWRFMGGFALGAFVLFWVSLGTVGVTQAGQIHGFFTNALTAIRSGPRPGLDPSSMTNVYGLACFLLTKIWANIATVVGSVVLLAWAARKAASMPFAVLLALCVSVHLYLHDLTLLLLPLIIMLDRQVRLGLLDTPRADASSKRRSLPQVAIFISSCLLLASPLQLWLMGCGWLPLLAIPLLILTITFPFEGEGQQDQPSLIGTLQDQSAIAAG